jgi:hypothetical protein
MMEPSYNRPAPIAALVLALFVTGAAVDPGVACADRMVTLRLTAGEVYEIRNVEPDTTPAVSFTENSNSFTLKRSGPHAFTVFSFQPGEGMVETTSVART